MRKLAQRKWADSFDLVLDFRKKRIKKKPKNFTSSCLVYLQNPPFSTTFFSLR